MLFSEATAICLEMASNMMPEISYFLDNASCLWKQASLKVVMTESDSIPKD